MSEIVGKIEIAKKKNVTGEAVRIWIFKGIITKPTYPSVNGGPAWEWPEVEAQLRGERPVPTPLADPIGAREIAELLGVATRTVHNWKSSKKILPNPEYVSVNGLHAWERSSIIRWANTTGRGERLPAEFAS